MDSQTKTIESLQISTNNTDLKALGVEVTALKLAVGLIFQKLHDSHRDALLKELRQTNTPELNDLAKQLEQFRV